MDDAAFTTLVAVAMAVGVTGTVVPVLPGLVLVWAAALVYGLVAGFGTVGVVAFVIITGLAVVGIVISFVIPRRAAARGGATRSSMWLGALLAIAGFFVVPVVGLVVGGVLGVFLGEVARTRNTTAAWRTTIATIKGFGMASVLQVVVALAMVIAWVPWVVVG